jgi:hypothetical protein
MSLASRLILLTMAAALITQAADLASIFAMYSSKGQKGLGPRLTLKIDGRKVARLRFPTYYRIDVPPGVYAITMDESDKAPIICHLIAGETCYIRARTVGKQDRAEVELLSPTQASEDIRRVIPLEPEHVYLKKWQ